MFAARRDDNTAGTNDLKAGQSLQRGATPNPSGWQSSPPDGNIHTFALLRYFEIRDQIFLTLIARGWQKWATALGMPLSDLSIATPDLVAAVIAQSLVPAARHF